MSLRLLRSRQFALILIKPSGSLASGYVSSQRDSIRSSFVYKLTIYNVFCGKIRKPFKLYTNFVNYRQYFIFYGSKKFLVSVISRVVTVIWSDKMFTKYGIFKTTQNFAHASFLYKHYTLH